MPSGSGCRIEAGDLAGYARLSGATEQSGKELQNPTQVCVGRMRLTLPGPASTVFSEQAIDDVEIVVKTLKTGQTEEQEWSDYVRTVSESRAFAGGRSAVLNKPQVAGRPALLQRLADAPDSNVALDVWFPIGNKILQLRVQGAPSERALLEPALLRVRPAIEIRDGLQPGLSDFCISGGVVHLDPGSGENIAASVVFDGGRYQLDVETVVQKQAYAPTLLARWDRESLPKATAIGVTPHILLREKMRWNGSDAEQIASSMMIPDPGKPPAPQQNAQLTSSGIALDAFKPYVSLELGPYLPYPQPALSDPEFVALWRGLQKSITFSGGSVYGSR